MKKSFIEDFYDKRDRNIKQLGLLGFLFYKLRRFETHRSTATINLFKNHTYTKILDIGCGNGYLLSQIKHKCPNANLFGVDVSAVSIDECKNNLVTFTDNFSVQNIDSGLSFQENSFDLIVMVATLEHVFDPIRALEEVSRILKPGGTFIVEVPNIAFMRYRINLLFGIRPRTSWGYGWDGGHLNYFTRKDLKKGLENAGLVSKIITGSGIFLSLRTWWGALLLPNIIIEAKKLK